MDASVIVIGDEILLGQVTDTNSGDIARTLTPEGWNIRRVMTVGDDAAEIRRAVDMCMADSMLTVTTGGLGPTKDDITKGVMTEVFGGEPVLREDVLEHIRTIFERRGRTLNESTRTQAIVPSSAHIITNPQGTAPVMWFERGGHALVCLPGVPYETRAILADGELTDRIRATFADTDIHRRHHTVMCAGVTESGLSEYLEPFETSLAEGLHLAYLPTPGLIKLRLDGAGRDREALDRSFDTALARLTREYGKYIIYAGGEATMAEIVLRRARGRGLTLATAESCTGGNIAHSLTAVPGSSDVYLGGVVSYANAVKEGVLGVASETLAAHGAVSREVVTMMTEGARRITGADVAVATSGIAGPGGGTPDKPVGTVWMAVATSTGTEAMLHQFPGNRATVITRATNQALLEVLSRI